MSNIQLQIATTKVLSRKLSDDNHTISQILGIKFIKVVCPNCTKLAL